LIRLRIGTDGELLWMRKWTFWFRKMRGISCLGQNRLASQEGLCFSRFTSPENGSRSQIIHRQFVVTVKFIAFNHCRCVLSSVVLKPQCLLYTSTSLSSPSRTGFKTSGYGWSANLSVSTSGPRQWPQRCQFKRRRWISRIHRQMHIIGLWTVSLKTTCFGAGHLLARCQHAPLGSYPFGSHRMYSDVSMLALHLTL
jgi:hypothetical protein